MGAKDKTSKTKGAVYPQVQDCKFMREVDLNVLMLLFIPFIIISYKIPELVIAEFALVLPVWFYLRFEQKRYYKNIEAWKRKSMEPGFILIDNDSELVTMGGYEIKFSDVNKLNIVYNPFPPMKGFTQIIFYLYFFNCTLEFILKDGRVVKMPIHLRKDIKTIVKQFTKSRAKFQMHFDAKIYKFCGLKD